MIMVVSPAVGGSGIPTFKLLKESASHLGGAIQNELEDRELAAAAKPCRRHTGISYGVFNDITCHVRMQYIRRGCKMLLDLQA